MSKLVFLWFGKDYVSADDFKKLVVMCNSYFTHVYISMNVYFRDNCLDTITTDDDTLVIRKASYNQNNDSNGLYFIEFLNNNVKSYSMKINITDKWDAKLDETNNIHVNYYHLDLTKKIDFDLVNNEILFNLLTFFDKSCSQTHKSVAIVDLDDTLIDKDGEIIIQNLNQYLHILRTMFDYVILWSHGSIGHVNHVFNKNLAPFKKSFSDVIARTSSFFCMNKGIGTVLRHLNQKFSICSLSHTLLIDDQSKNYKYDYDYFIHAPNIPVIHNERMWAMLKDLYHNLYHSEIMKVIDH